MSSSHDFDIISTIHDAFLSGQSFDSSLLRPDILASWKRSRLNHVDAESPHFPAVTEADIQRGKAHVSGYTTHIRNSSSFYYQKEVELLDSVRACLCYVSSDLDIYGRYGNQELKDELKQHNIRLGTNLSEIKVGTNAAALSSLTQNDTWVVGAEHYCRALHNYACFSFPIRSGYNKSFFVMLIIRKQDLTPRIKTLFQFIKSSELIVSSGMTTSDMILKNDLLEQMMSKNGTVLVMVNQDGKITYVNDVYLKLFHSDVFDVINHPLQKVIPILDFTLECLISGIQITTKEVVFPGLPAGKNRFFLDATPIQRDKNRAGMVIMLTRQQNIANLVHKVTNLNAKFTFADLIGEAPSFVRTKEIAAKVAHSPSTVLIVGESGTGKELFAHSLHSESQRCDGPFISVNCAAIPRELIGSELFGYVPGAFTGASKGGAQGKFELANGGTLFLDEVAEMPLDMQSVLLRVLEEKSITRIGGNKPVPVNVRLIAATNKDLQTYVSNGQFRLDLYYRLNVIQIPLVPLRERISDIPLLVQHFLGQFSKSLLKQVTGITPDALTMLCNYSWPGNVRELRNVIERGVNIASGSELTPADLPAALLCPPAEAGFRAEPKTASAFSRLDEIQNAHKLELVQSLMEQHHGNKSIVAKELGIARTTLYRMLKTLERQ